MPSLENRSLFRVLHLLFILDCFYYVVWPLFQVLFQSLAYLVKRGDFSMWIIIYIINQIVISRTTEDVLQAAPRPRQPVPHAHQLALQTRGNQPVSQKGENQVVSQKRGNEVAPQTRGNQPASQAHGSQTVPQRNENQAFSKTNRDQTRENQPVSKTSKDRPVSQMHEFQPVSKTHQPVSQTCRKQPISQTHQPDPRMHHTAPTENMPPAEGSNSLITCVVCFNDSNQVDIPKAQIARFSSNCEHQRQVCTECARRYIYGLIGQGLVQNIHCLEEGCNAILSTTDVNRFVTRKGFTRYQTLLLRELETDPEFRWCCNPKCKSGQMHRDGEQQPIMTCVVCGAKTCFTHRVPWHNGHTCKQYDEDMKKGKRSSSSLDDSEARMIRKLERKGMKRCPKCNQGIMKSGGCDLMTCERSAGGCGAGFCWLCLADYNGRKGIRQVGNAAHRPSCTHYS